MQAKPLSADYLNQCLKTLENVDPAQPATHRQLVDLLAALPRERQFKLVELLWTRHAKSFDKIWSDPKILRSFLKVCRVLSCYEYMLVRMTDRVYQQWEDQRSYMGIGLTYQYTSSHQYTKLFSEQRHYLERAVTHIKTLKGLQWLIAFLPKFLSAGYIRSDISREYVVGLPQFLSTESIRRNVINNIKKQSVTWEHLVTMGFSDDIVIDLGASEKDSLVENFKRLVSCVSSEADLFVLFDHAQAEEYRSILKDLFYFYLTIPSSEETLKADVYTHIGSLLRCTGRNWQKSMREQLANSILDLFNDSKYADYHTIDTMLDIFHYSDLHHALNKFISELNWTPERLFSALLIPTVPGSSTDTNIASLVFIKQAKSFVEVLNEANRNRLVEGMGDSRLLHLLQIYLTGSSEKRSSTHQLSQRLLQQQITRGQYRIILDAAEPMLKTIDDLYRIVALFENCYWQRVEQIALANLYEDIRAYLIAEKRHNPNISLASLCEFALNRYQSRTFFNPKKQFKALFGQDVSRNIYQHMQAALQPYLPRPTSDSSQSLSSPNQRHGYALTAPMALMWVQAYQQTLAQALCGDETRTPDENDQLLINSGLYSDLVMLADYFKKLIDAEPQTKMFTRLPASKVLTDAKGTAPAPFFSPVASVLPTAVSAAQSPWSCSRDVLTNQLPVTNPVISSTALEAFSPLSESYCIDALTGLPFNNTFTPLTAYPVISSSTELPSVANEANLTGAASAVAAVSIAAAAEQARLEEQARLAERARLEEQARLEERERLAEEARIAGTARALAAVEIPNDSPTSTPGQPAPVLLGNNVAALQSSHGASVPAPSVDVPPKKRELVML